VTEPRPHQPTAKWLRKARQRGELAYTPLLTRTAVLVGGLVGVYWSAPILYREFHAATLRALRVVQGESVGSAELMLRAAGQGAAVVLLPVFLLVVIAALVAGLVQTRGLVAPKAALPDWERVNLFRGFRRLFALHKGVDVGLVVTALIAAFGLLSVMLYSEASSIAKLARMDALASLSGVLELSMIYVTRSIFFLALLSILDLGYQHWRFMQEHRMTRREVSKEAKEDEGDPQHRSYRTARWREVVPDTDVRDATVLISGVPSVVVALAYTPGNVPRLVAVARHARATHLIQLASGHGVPCVEDRDLAYRLGQLPVGQYVSQDLFGPVAQVVHSLSRPKS
jgi:type III secretion protein U